MFEQSIILPEQTHKRWTFAASVAVEAMAVGVLMLIPLIYTDALGRGLVGPMRVGAPPIKQPIAIQVTASSAPRARAPHTPFRLPSVLRPLAEVMRTPEIDAAPAPDCPNCVVSNFPPADAVSLIGSGQGTVPLPPPPTVKPPETARKIKTDPSPPARPVEVSRGVQEAKIIRRVIPQYPALARSARVQGTVKLMSVISKDGRIERLEVQSGHPLLVRAAVEAVQQWLYKPTLLNGEPVEVVAPIEVHFTLSN